MKLRTRAACAALLLPWLAVAPPASANQFPFAGTLSIAIAQLPAVLVPGSGIATLNPNASGVHLESAVLPAGAFAQSGFSISVSAPSAFPIAGLKVTAANGTGSFARAGGALGGAMPIQGVAKVCLFATCGGAPPANVSVPVSVVGSGGTITAAGVVNVTVRGAPWTTSASSGGFAVGPDGLASSTAQTGGRLNLATPIFISTNIGALSEISATGRVELAFEQPPPLCEVAVNQSTYADGDALILTRVRFANPAAANFNGHLRLEFVVPVGGGLVLPVLDSDATLAPGFDNDVAPVDAFTVSSSQPRGDYQLRCRISDAAGATIVEHVAAFRFE